MHKFRDSLSAGLQHRMLPPDNRQQQQDNGTREFQPQMQQGDAPMARRSPWPDSEPARPRLRLAG